MKIPGVGGVLPLDASTPAPPKFPLDDPFVAYSLDVRAADACGKVKVCISKTIVIS